jgi:2-keto-4-pentenoate hydratase
VLQLDGEFAAGTLDDALAAQLGVLELWQAGGEKLGGWKVGLTSGPNRDLLGPGVRPFGFVRATRVLRTGARTALPANGACRLEPELCLTLGTDLAGTEVTPDDARAAVSVVAAGFEINELRLPRTTSTHLQVADDLGQWGVVVGSGGPAPASALVDTSVDVWRDGEHVASTTPGASMDDPFHSLALLCHALARFGLGLTAGEHVITGAFSAYPVDGPGDWQARFHGVGDVAVTFG